MIALLQAIAVFAVLLSPLAIFAGVFICVDKLKDFKSAKIN